MGLTQGQVAEAMEWSLSKVARIEAGEVSVSTDDLRRLLRFFGIVDSVQVRDLVEATKLSRARRKWWDEASKQRTLTPALRQLIQYEADAKSIHCFLYNTYAGKAADTVIRSCPA